MQKPTYNAFIAGYSDTNIKPKDIQIALEKLKVKNIIRVDIPTKKWKGYAFIEFTDPQSLSWFNDLKQISVKGRELQIKKHKSGQELRKEKKMTEKRRIFVQNIPIHWTDDDLLRAFSPEGEVEECYIVKKGERSGTSSKSKIDKKVGYVLFNEVNDALRLIAMNELEVQGTTVFIKKSRTRNIEKQPPSSGKSQSYKRNFSHTGNFRNKDHQQFERKSFSPRKQEQIYHQKAYAFQGHHQRNYPNRNRHELPQSYPPHSARPEAHRGQPALTMPKHQLNFTIQEQDVHSRPPTGGRVTPALDFHGESIVINRKNELFLHRIKPFESDYFIFRRRNKYLNTIMADHQFCNENLTLNKIVYYSKGQIPNQNN